MLSEGKHYCAGIFSHYIYIRRNSKVQNTHTIEIVYVSKKNVESNIQR